MDLTNKTSKALRVSLPGGKKLFLAPGKTGQVSPKALKHPAVIKLIEAGELESSDGGSGLAQTKQASSGISGTGTQQGGTGAMRQSGDR